jgi:hypothetical protein
VGFGRIPEKVYGEKSGEKEELITSYLSSSQ